MVASFMMHKREKATPPSSPRSVPEAREALDSSPRAGNDVTRSMHDQFVKNTGLNASAGSVQKVFPAGVDVMKKSAWISKIASTRRASFWQGIATAHGADHLEDAEDIVEEILACMAFGGPQAALPVKLPKVGT